MTEHTIELTTSDGETLSFVCSQDQDIISAAEQADIYLNAQCHSGACGACIAHCDAGEFQLDDYSEDALSASDRAQGHLLLCRTRPSSNMRLSLPYERSLIRSEKLPLRTARISAKTYLTPDTVKLELQLEATEDGTLSLDFEPGQFVQLSIPDTEITRPYSLANAPNWDGSLELLIKLRPHGQFSTWLQETAEPGMALRLEGPFGTFVLRDNGLRPRYFVAGGCGIASVMSMLRRMAEWGEPHPVKLFFGVWNEDELFYRDEIEALASEYPNLDCHICITKAGDTWDGCRGSAVDAFAEALANEATEPDIYICGSPGLIDSIAEVAEAHGIARDKLIFERFLASASGTQPVRCEIA